MMLLQVTNIKSQAEIFSSKKDKSERTSSSSEKSMPLLTPVEIQGAVMSYADTFAAVVGELLTSLENEATTYQGRLYAAEARLFGISSAIQIASEPKPAVAMLDMMVFTTLKRIAWEEYWVPKVYGKQRTRCYLR